MPRGTRSPLTPEKIAEAKASYQAGETEQYIAERLHVGPKKLRTALLAAGVTLRTRAETCRLRALSQHSSPLWDYTAARLTELYWGPERPSLPTLAARLRADTGCRIAVKHLRAVLKAHGIRIRTPVDQLAIDGRMGRRAAYAGHGNFTSEDYARNREAMLAGVKKRCRNHDYLRRMGEAHRKSETRVCAWCGTPVTRIPCLFRTPPERTYHNRACANAGQAHRRRHPDSPRPRIVEAMRTALGPRPPTWEHLEPLAARFGATEEELFFLAQHG